MYQEAPEQLERRVLELQSQIDRLSLSLHVWREKQDHLQPLEKQLSDLTKHCAEIVERWASTGERHARAVNELEERLQGWNTTEARLHRDAADRMQELRHSIEEEWGALRRLHEEPVKQLREQASTLTAVSVAAATSSLNNVERAEARLAGIEATLQERLTELSEQVRTAVAELRAPQVQQTRALPEPLSPAVWPLEGVVRLHNQLRESDGRSGEEGERVSPTQEPRRLVEGTPSHDRMEPREGVVPDAHAYQAAAPDMRGERPRWLWWAAVVVLAAAIGTSVLVTRLQRETTAAASRVAAAEHQAQVTAQAASQQLAAAREEAARQIAEARDTAFKTQMIGSVLAAPDLVRYNLVGRDTAVLASAQALWSRSRGFVFSASRMPAPGPSTGYQIWLLTNAEPVSAGLFVPDAKGRVTFATDSLPQIPRPVIGVSVTAEPTGGRPAPGGPILLARAPAAP